MAAIRTITITTSSFGKDDAKILASLNKKKIKVILNPYGRKLEAKEIEELCKDSCGIIAGTEIYTADVLKKLDNLKVISRCGVGMENIDLAAAEKLGVKICNTPDAPTTAVAELTLGMILNILRKINLMDSDIRGGRWKKMMGNLLCGKKVGIVGFGRIGRKVHGLLQAFGCEAAYTDLHAVQGVACAKRLPLANLLKWADIVSIHAATKKPIIGKKELALMKKGSYLINVSRGEALDEKALYKSLKSGHLAGAALDVFRKEPYKGDLTKLNNIVLTPHIGSYAIESRIKMERQSVDNLIKGLSWEVYDV